MHQFPVQSESNRNILHDSGIRVSVHKSNHILHQQSEML